MTTATRIGPMMLAATGYVSAHPGITKYRVSVWVGPHGSNSYGWRSVQRALAAGLIENRGTPRRAELYVTDAGRAALAT